MNFWKEFLLDLFVWFTVLLVLTIAAILSGVSALESPAVLIVAASSGIVVFTIGYHHIQSQKAKQ